MKYKIPKTIYSRVSVRFLVAALTCSSLLVPGNAVVFAQTAPSAEAPAQAAEKIPPEQLDSLVAPIALYPDPLLSQTLVASTYPLEIMQLHQWLVKNPELVNDQKKLTDNVLKQPWDPSIQAMAPMPDVVKWLAEDVQWTTDLGNAFLAQQGDVMAAVQRMRAKAKEKGTLASNEQQSVQTQVIENKEVIVIEQANPQVVYVPSYDPMVVYGAMPYPYPPIYYPPCSGTGAAVAAGVIGFGVGIAIGAAWGGGGWGWNAGWGGGDVDINVNNNFNRNTNINGGNRNNINTGNRGGQGGKWQHNAAHRGGAPYGDRGTADRFGGSARGDSLSNRQSGARQQLGRQGNTLPSTRDANRGGVGDQSGRSGNRDGVSDRSSDRVGDRSSSDRDRANSSSDRMNDRSSSNRSSGSSDRMSDRSSSSRSSGFGGGSSGWDGGSARSSSSRGSSSMSSSRGGGGGGMSRGGGGGGGRRR